VLGRAHPAFARAAVVTAMCVGSTGVAVLAAAPAHAATSDAFAYLSKLNAERKAHGLPALTLRSDLTSVAQSWAGHMASARLLSHNPRLTTQVRNWLAVGENVGAGPTVTSLDLAFMASPAHRSNVLDRTYRDIGIGTVRSNGVLWITVDFRQPEYAESSATIVRPPTTTTVARTATVVVHRTLTMGSRGSDVASVQRKLHVTVDGIFGPHTRRAVVAFQRRRHLRANGVVAASTWKALGL
jgi:peptidoglycan hydrolase-like protein with peptidoglycan-binding domain